MNLAEQQAVGEVARVVENYNAAISEQSPYDGVGHIDLGYLPDDPEDLIKSVLTTMLKQKMALEQANESEVAEEVNWCVTQIHDAKQTLA